MSMSTKLRTIGKLRISLCTYLANGQRSNTEILTPACVFRPVSAGDVSVAVTTLQRGNGTAFAVRGGGHMGIKV